MPGTLIRWDPVAELGDLRSRWDRLLDGFPFDRAQTWGAQTWAPAIDVEHSNGNLVVRADVPGIRPSEVKIEVENGILTVSGEEEQTSEKKDEQYLRRERRYGAFSRSMTLPEGVDPHKITATTHDGVVELTIPLPPHSSQERVEITPTEG